MPNIRKTFSFRDGVQVDDDDFIVRGNLVGIGTTVPTEKLDIRGNLVATGVVTSTNLYISGVSTFSEIRAGSGITISATSGIISATTFFGDGQNLTNLPTSQWKDVNIGVGVTSIYNTGNVGVGTTDPVYQLQIGGDPNGGFGVGINSTGQIYVSGISTFVGDVVVGSASSVSLGSTAYLGDNNRLIIGNSNDLDLSHNGNDSIISNATGIFSIRGDDIRLQKADGTATMLTADPAGSVGLYNNDSLKVSTTGVGATIYGNTETQSLNVSGITTFNDDINFKGANYNVSWDQATSKIKWDDNAQATFGDINDLQIYHTTSGGGGSVIKDNFGDLSIQSDKLYLRNKDGNEPFLEATDNGSVVLYHDFLPRLETTGAGVTISGSQLEVFSSSGQAQLGIGQSLGIGNSTSVFRYNNKTLDIINNETGNLNMVIHGGTAGLSTGRFDWLYGQNNNELMSLTYDGKLGINQTSPANTLHVVGTSTVTGNSFVGGNITITGSIDAGTFNLPNVIVGSNLHNTAGITTLNNLKVAANVDASTASGKFNEIGVNTTSLYQADFRVDGTSTFQSTVGFGTTAINSSLPNAGALQVHNNGILVRNSWIQLDGTTQSTISIGTTQARSSVDIRGIGTNDNNFMLPPQVTTAQQVGLGTIAGAVVYNTQTNKLQVYNGTAWQNCN